MAWVREFAKEDKVYGANKSQWHAKLSRDILHIFIIQMPDLWQLAQAKGTVPSTMVIGKYMRCLNLLKLGIWVMSNLDMLIWLYFTYNNTIVC